MKVVLFWAMGMIGAGVRSGEHFADEHWTGMEPVTTIHDIGALPRTLRLLEEP